MSIIFNGVVNMIHAIVRSFKVANTAAIAVGDILVNDGWGGNAGSGYVTPWSSGKGLVGVALEPKAQPTNDGDSEVQVALALPTLEVRVDAAGITQACHGLYCNVDGPQSIDVTADENGNAWIVGVDVANEKAIVILFPRPIITTPVNQGVVSP
jgi:hypothetical protein